MLCDCLVCLQSCFSWLFGLLGGLGVLVSLFVFGFGVVKILGCWVVTWCLCYCFVVCMCCLFCVLILILGLIVLVIGYLFGFVCFVVYELFGVGCGCLGFGGISDCCLLLVLACLHFVGL